MSSLKVGKCSYCGKENCVVGDGGCAVCLSEKKCINYDFCEQTGPLWCIQYCHRGYCSNCATIFFRKPPLQFRPPTESDPCAVCMSADHQMMKFPAADCTHWFCVQCSRDIIWWREWRYHLDPVPFGCPPCPNGCNNPEEGQQCGCEEYDAVQDAWEQQFPQQWKAWNDAEHWNIDRPHPEHRYGSKECPLCRGII